jgi:hypothetical protein
MLGPGGTLEPDSRTSWHPIRIQPAAANRNLLWQRRSVARPGAFCFSSLNVF